MKKYDSVGHQLDRKSRAFSAHIASCSIEISVISSDAIVYLVNLSSKSFFVPIVNRWSSMQTTKFVH